MQKWGGRKTEYRSQNSELRGNDLAGIQNGESAPAKKNVPHPEPVEGCSGYRM